jgi:hypothetical protein
MIKDSEAKQIEANEIIAALDRAGLDWDPKIVTLCPQDFAELTAKQKHDATQAAIDAFENLGERLHQAGEHEIADKYFKHPGDLSEVLGYLPK